LKEKKKKIPRVAESPPGGKQARVDPAAVVDWDSLQITWQFRNLDHDGPFGWRVCNRETLVHTILGRTSDFESMTWRELRANGLLHHTPLDRICAPARRRLEEISQNDVDELHSLRIGKKHRVWGIRDRLYFKVIWWDPEHQVWPMNITDN
jgi:hypothetical protein